MSSLPPFPTLCRVSVFEKAGKNYIGMLSPVVMFNQFSDNETLATVARSVEEAFLNAINEAL